MTYFLPPLPYSYSALEPFFDEQTMRIHHTKHHQNYVNNTNAILKNTTFSSLSIEELISIFNEIILDEKTILQNNAGGHINHILFWEGLKTGSVITSDIKKEIDHHFGTFEHFQKKFEEVAMSHFGSGWVWLLKKNGGLAIVTTNNQDNPLMGSDISHTYGMPIMCLDLWEHAYYLKYQNRRLDYIKSFWNIVNWEKISDRLQK